MHACSLLLTASPTRGFLLTSLVVFDNVGILRLSQLLPSADKG